MKMLRFAQQCRFFCRNKISNCKKSVIQNGNEKIRVDFSQLFHKSKVPAGPIAQVLPQSSEIVEIDACVIQLLERLALVDLDSKEALVALESSIQFASKISHIDTTGVGALYTVQEAQELCLRDDAITDGDCREKVLQNAKLTDEHYFVSPPGNIPLQQEGKTFIKA